MAQIPVAEEDIKYQQQQQQQLKMIASSSLSSHDDDNDDEEEECSSFSASSLFPKGKLDINDQQVDLRRTNSWLLKLEQIETVEAAERLMARSHEIDERSKKSSRQHTNPSSSTVVPKFIINVSAMEGKFYRHKTANHPHTNMAKAALNMMTRTAASGYAEDFIFMNSVDTGWINDENPLEKAKKIAEKQNFQTPIDEVDAAARILDPIMIAINKRIYIYGKFLKDYKPTEW
eukprot:jgi/Bigna1/133049/aug1.20_g7757